MGVDFDKMVDDMCGKVDDGKILSKGKNSRSAVIEHGIRFDSKEELDVFEWILEAKDLGFVSGFEYQPKSFELFAGLKNERGKFIVRPHVYTADFRVSFTDAWLCFRKANRIKVFDRVDERTVFMDVKGAYSIYDDGRSFTINSKWVLDKYGVYVWKVVPLKLFEKTWLPKRCVLTRKTKKVSAKYSSLKVFERRGFEKKTP